MTWWRRLLQRKRLDVRLDAELRDHLERQVADYMRVGLTEAEARHKTRLAFGGLDQVKEDCRDVRGTRWLEEFAQDLRYGARLLRQSKGLTLVAVCSLALGIGANSAIFSLVDGLLLKTLPVREPQRLVLLDQGSWTNPIWEQIRDRQSALFESAMAWSGTRFDLSAGGQTEVVEGIWASGGFFDVLGVPAVLGRTFTPQDDRRGGGPDGPVAVISYSFWQRRFAGAADVIGRPLRLDRVPFTIIGVTPPEFFGPSVGRSFDVVVPLGAESIVRGAESILDGRSTWWLDIMARLKPGQTVEQATTALRRVQPQIREATLPDRWRREDLDRYLREGLTLILASAGPAGLRNRYQQPLLVVMVVVSLVLLIACANIANLLLARAAGRRHEFSVRMTIGASRFRLGRQLLAESLLLAGLGAALGLAFAQWGSRLLVGQLSTVRETVFLDLPFDWRIVGFTAAVAVATALLFGIAPAFRAGRAEPTEALKEQGRTLTGDGRRPLGSPLVVVQVALSLVLVVAAGLFMRTFALLATLDLGFDRDPLMSVSVSVQRADVTPEQRPALYQRILAAVQAVPGVAGAGLSDITPVSGAGWNNYFEFPGGPQLTERQHIEFMNAITPGWFATYGTALRAGRDFDARDRPGAPLVAIVNEAFARKYTNGASPIGRTLLRRGPPGEPMSTHQIVGLVENAVYRSIRGPIPPIVYLPVAQVWTERARASYGLTIRAATGNPALLTKSITAAIGQVDPNVSLTFRPLAAYVDSALTRERILAMLSGFFGALALLLAGIGLYGMTSYAVSRRRSEIGIRMALGASATRVVRLVLGRVALLVGLGVALGAAVSLWASRFVGTLLYGLEPRDPTTFIGAALVLAAIGALSAWLPARRAARIDPARVLREG